MQKREVRKFLRNRGISYLEDPLGFCIGYPPGWSINKAAVRGMAFLSHAYYEIFLYSDEDVLESHPILWELVVMSYGDKSP